MEGDSGQWEWTVDGPPLAPHEFDYKRRLHDEAVASVRGWLGREPGQSLIPLQSMLDVLVEKSDRIAYDQSSAKRGVFLQASCVLTSRDALGRRESVLLQLRSSNQWHNPSDLRNLAGTACLIGTALAKGTFLDDRAQISNDVFSRITEGRRNALALFGRKLLIPAPVVYSRFLGLGFNFRKWISKGVGYLHLVWEITVKDGALLDPAMVVPERTTKAHDQLQRVDITEAEAIIDAEARIDRAVMEHLTDAKRRPRIGDDASGLLTAAMFALPQLGGTTSAGEVGARVHRDAVVFDIIRMFQTSVHRGTTVVKGDSEKAFQEAFAQYVADLGRQLDVRIECSREGFLGATEREGRPDFFLRIGGSRDERGQVPAHWEYLIECKVSDSFDFSPKAIQQCEEYSARGVRRAGPKHSDSLAECVILLQGVRGEHSILSVGGFETIRPESSVFGLRVALDWRAPSKQLAVVEVAHALIPIRIGPSLAIVVLRPPATGERARLIGGRLDGGVEGGRSLGVEQPEDGIRRELDEELQLDASAIEEISSVMPSVCDDSDESAAVDPFFPALGVSRGSRSGKEYRFYAHVVALTEAGKVRLRELLREGWSSEGHEVRAVTLREWEHDGLGFQPDYARRVSAALDRERLDAAAIPVDPKHLAWDVGCP